MKMVKRTTKYFAKGAGMVWRYENSDTLLFNWNGKADGSARHIPHVKRYVRNGVEFESMAALLRWVEGEHKTQAA